jgi:hypothetical protein
VQSQGHQAGGGCRRDQNPALGGDLRVANNTGTICRYTPGDTVVRE